MTAHSSTCHSLCTNQLVMCITWVPSCLRNGGPGCLPVYNNCAFVPCLHVHNCRAQPPDLPTALQVCLLASNSLFAGCVERKHTRRHGSYMLYAAMCEMPVIAALCLCWSQHALVPNVASLSTNATSAMHQLCGLNCSLVPQYLTAGSVVSAQPLFVSSTFTHQASVLQLAFDEFCMDCLLPSLLCQTLSLVLLFALCQYYYHWSV